VEVTNGKECHPCCQKKITWWRDFIPTVIDSYGCYLHSLYKSWCE